MNVYLISYDLVSPGQHYPQVHAAIRSIGEWSKPLESTWFVKTNLSVSQVRDTVQKAMDSNDKLLVIQVTRNMAGFRLPDAVWKWMTDNI